MNLESLSSVQRKIIGIEIENVILRLWICLINEGIAELQIATLFFRLPNFSPIFGNQTSVIICYINFFQFESYLLEGHRVI